MIKSETWHKIGMHEWSPVWLKMYCLKQIFRNIRRHIETLPPAERALFDASDTKSGVFRG